MNPQPFEGVNAFKDEDHVTLLTCDFYLINTHRLLVRGKKTKLEEVRPVRIQKKLQVEWGILIVILLFTFIKGILIMEKKKLLRILLKRFGFVILLVIGFIFLN